MALAFLPSKFIQAAFEDLVEDCRREFGDYFDDFNKYFEDEWMKKVTPEGFSIYRQTFATNNFLESYHRLITSKIGKKPTASNFLSKKLYLVIII